MQIIRRLDRLRSATGLLRSQGGSIALVPTMGALHDGHLKLVREAKALAEHVVVSIFVNPLQFGAGEDLDAYPRQEEADAALLSEAGVSILWAPPASEVYPQGFATTVSVGGLGDGLCGAARPGHFDGVATVVTKLFNQVAPDIAFFGEKDYQQLAIIRALVRDLNMNLEIMAVPTVRAEDGLALSSRNAYLSAEERAAAAALPKAMQAAAAALTDGADVAATLADAETALKTAGFSSIDYVALCDAGNLQPLDRVDRPARLLVAARIGKTRLIDNLAVLPAK